MIIEARGDVVTVRGALDENHWDAIAAAVDLVLPSHPGGILMDCSGITAVSDLGAATFMDGLSYMEERGARIILCSVPATITDRLRSIPGLHSQVPIAPNAEVGRRSLSTGSAKPLAARGIGRVLLVPVNPPFYPEPALRLLGHYHLSSATAIHFLYALVVPRSLPVGAPLPEDEILADAALSAAEQAVGHTVVARHVGRARNVPDAIVEAAIKLGAAEVVIGLERVQVGEEMGSILVGLREKCPCTLTFTQAPLEAPKAGTK